MIRIAPFSQRLQQAMGNTKSSDLAIKSGISKQSISAYLSGSRKPKRDAIVRLAATLKVSPDWLEGYDVPAAPGAFYLECDPDDPNCDHLIIPEFTTEESECISYYYLASSETQDLIMMILKTTDVHRNRIKKLLNAKEHTLTIIDAALSVDDAIN